VLCVLNQVKQKADVIAEKAGMPREKTEQPTRKVLGDLVFKEHPVVSDQDGFWLAAKREDLLLCALNYRRRADSTAKRAQVLERMALREDVDEWLSSS